MEVCLLKEKILYLSWLCMYVLCAGLGTIPETGRNTVGHIVLTILSVLFFIPGTLLLYDGITKDIKRLRVTVRVISLISLILTLSMIILNIVLIRAWETVENLLNDLLILVSAPMYCAYWKGLGPFFWACLFVSSFPRMWKK